jgi:hypothetical protein
MDTTVVVGILAAVASIILLLALSKDDEVLVDGPPSKSYIFGELTGL